MVPAERGSYLEVCDLFGQTAAQHHDQLVSRFIEAPAASLRDVDLQGVTASGPPLPVLLRALEVLRDMRIAANRPDITTRHADLLRLRNRIASGTRIAPPSLDAVAPRAAPRQ